jgi:hypothetical protein
MPADPGVTGEVELTDYPRTMVVFRELNPGGGMTLWRRPEPGVLWRRPEQPHFYTIGARWSPEWSVAFVIDRRGGGEQVAMYRHPCAPAEFAEIVMLLGRFYDMAFLVPEINNTIFRDSLLRTKHPLERIYSRKRDPRGVGSGRPEYMGFEVTAATRSLALQALADAIRGIGASITIRSQIALDECRAFVSKPNGEIGRGRVSRRLRVGGRARRVRSSVRAAAGTVLATD